MPIDQEIAIDIWVETAKGTKVREICAKHDIDPRRVFEVREQKKFPEALSAAKHRLATDGLPWLVDSPRLVPHVPRLSVVKKKGGSDDPNQGSLF